VKGLIIQNECSLSVMRGWMYANLAHAQPRSDMDEEINLAHAQPYSDMAEEINVGETSMSCFICCRIGVLWTQFLFQTSIWKEEFVEYASFYCFQFHHFFCCLIRTRKIQLRLFPAGSSFSIFGSNNHFCLFLFC